MLDERLFPVGSYYAASGPNQNIEQLLGFGRWELKEIRTPEGKYIYVRVS